MDRFDALSPLDFRYSDEGVKKFFSERSSVRYRLLVESALVDALADREMCPRPYAVEIARACELVTAEDVYAEEEKVRHDVRALVNCIKSRVSDGAKPYVHLTATSSDIVCTADSLRFKDAAEKLVIPGLLELEASLVLLARREKGSVQIGRTHGQHAEPITFGFAVAEYVSRLGGRIAAIRRATSELRGKMSGAVGNYNASSLFFDDPENFERLVLSKLGLMPATHSTQIVEPEFLVDYMSAVVSAFGVLANLADDMRHLQRSEISEVAERFESAQVGSSTMPHKRNPINFENCKSMWKAFMPRMTTLYMDQISEHQRDLTNSASGRFAAELVAALVISSKRLKRVIDHVVVDRESMDRNFSKSSSMISAEPAYILLASKGHPDAHEVVRKLTLKAQEEGKSFVDLFLADETLKRHISSFTPEQIDILRNPRRYTGIAEKKTEEICRYWEEFLGL